MGSFLSTTTKVHRCETAWPARRRRACRRSARPRPAGLAAKPTPSPAKTARSTAAARPVSRHRANRRRKWPQRRLVHGTAAADGAKQSRSRPRGRRRPTTPPSPAASCGLRSDLRSRTARHPQAGTRWLLRSRKAADRPRPAAVLPHWPSRAASKRNPARTSAATPAGTALRPRASRPGPRPARGARCAARPRTNCPKARAIGQAVWPRRRWTAAAEYCPGYACASTTPCGAIEFPFIPANAASTSPQRVTCATSSSAAHAARNSGRDASPTNRMRRVGQDRAAGAGPPISVLGGPALAGLACPTLR